MVDAIVVTDSDEEQLPLAERLRLRQSAALAPTPPSLRAAADLENDNSHNKARVAQGGSREGLGKAKGKGRGKAKGNGTGKDVSRAQPGNGWSSSSSSCSNSDDNSDVGLGANAGVCAAPQRGSDPVSASLARKRRHHASRSCNSGNKSDSDSDSSSCSTDSTDSGDLSPVARTAAQRRRIVNKPRVARATATAQAATRSERESERQRVRQAKEAEKQQRAKAREAERRRAREAKEAVKRQRAEAREAERRRKREAKEAEQKRKADIRAAEQQARGAHAHEEIELCAPTSFWASAAGAAVQEAMAAENLMCSAIQDGTGSNGDGDGNGNGGGGSSSTAQPRRPPFYILSWWSRPGVHFAANRCDVSASHVGWNVAWMTGRRFIGTVAGGTRAARALARRLRGAVSRLVFIVEGVGGAIAAAAKANYDRARREEPLVPAATEEEVEQMRVWLYVHEQCEIVLTRNASETADYLAGMTRVLSEQPYRHERTALGCVQKERAQSGVAAKGGDEGVKLANTWLRQLMQVPGVSETRAQAIVRAYPSFHALAQAYGDPTMSDAQKEALLENVMDGHTKQTVISRRVYRLYTCTDSSANL